MFTIKNVLSFDFSGRLNRRCYWVSLLTVAVITYLIFFALNMIKLALFGHLFLIGVYIYTRKFVVQRLHDLNYPTNCIYPLIAIDIINLVLTTLLGAFVHGGGAVSVSPLYVFISIMLLLLTLISAIAHSYIGFVKGNAGPNNYGPAPESFKRQK